MRPIMMNVVRRGNKIKWEKEVTEAVTLKCPKCGKRVLVTGNQVKRCTCGETLRWNGDYIQ